MEKQQTSNEYGISQELLVLSKLVNYGTVSIPYGNSARYDCILDIENDIYKIQIKSLNISKDGNSILVPMSNTRMSAEGIVAKEYVPEEVDFIAFYYNQKVYLVPTGLAKKQFTITLLPKIKDTQHYIEDFEIQKILDIDIKTWTELKEETRKNNSSEGKYFCPDCGAPVSRNGVRCITCARIMYRKIERPSRDILKDLIRTMPFTTIAKKYDVTDNAIRKWCKVYHLPTKTREIKKYSDEEWRQV